MPRLTDFLRGYRAVRSDRGLGRAAKQRCPTFAHAYVTAGLLGRSPWREGPVLVVAATQEAAAELEHELGLYCPGRTGRLSAAARGLVRVGGRGQTQSGRAAGPGRGRAS